MANGELMLLELKSSLVLVTCPGRCGTWNMYVWPMNMPNDWILYCTWYSRWASRGKKALERSRFSVFYFVVFTRKRCLTFHHSHLLSLLSQHCAEGSGKESARWCCIIRLDYFSPLFLTFLREIRAWGGRKPPRWGSRCRGIVDLFLCHEYFVVIY